MMMMIESLNIESNGLVFKGLRRTKFGQVVVAALLGSIPGCMGGFATVSLYTHKMFSFGALVAMMIASSGDEAFVMLAMIPEQALILFAVLFAIAVVVGVVIDMVTEHKSCGMKSNCTDGYVVHEHKEESKAISSKRTFGWRRILMLVGLAVFIAALATGHLGHDHSAHSHEHAAAHLHTEHECGELNECSEQHECDAHECTEHHECDELHECGELNGCGEEKGHSVNLLSEEWMNILFAGLSVIMLFVLLLGSDHFVVEHLWNHIIKKHLPTIFTWTFGVLLVVGIGLQYIEIDQWINNNTALMIVLATLIGIIPESGPHMIFVTLYAAGVVPLPVLLASCISQDGHSSIPLLAESKRSFIWAKLINCAVALAAGFAAMLFV